jgi:hypothetical protein
MTDTSSGRKVRFALLLGLLSFVGTAEAYLDAGSGSYLLQILMGIFLTLAVTLRLAWSQVVLKIRNLFQSRRGNGPDSPG